MRPECEDGGDKGSSGIDVSPPFFSFLRNGNRMVLVVDAWRGPNVPL